MIRSAIIAVLVALTSGCVGVGFYTDSQFRSAGEHDVFMDKKRNVVATTKEQILAVWGEPKTRQSDHFYEVWTYAGRGDVAWRGILVWAFLPLPLMLPVGNNDVAITFKPDGTVNSVQYGEVEATFYGCNIGFVCGTFSDVTHPTL